MKDRRIILFGSVVVVLFSLFVFIIVYYAPKGQISINKPLLFSNNSNIKSGEWVSNNDTLSTKRTMGDGKRRIVLQKHFNNKTQLPTLTQEDFYEANTIYVIRYDFLLAEEIVMPEDCILEFDGGSLRGGTIIGNNTSIKPADYSIFNNCVIKKFNLPYVDPRWVGAIPDFDEKTNKGTDNSSFFQMAYDNIAENHPGLDILIIGKYLISNTVLMRMQCHLRGIHNNTRGLVKRGLHYDTGGSSSLIAVGSCPAFRVIGKESEDKTWADLSIEHIKFLGLNKKLSIAIQYEASGAPSRPATIEKCEATNLLYFLYTKAREHSTLGNLTIRENNIYGCGKAIYSVSDQKPYMGFTSLKIENNLIEHNGDKSIHLNGCFGPIIIDNNILEGQPNPIYLTNTWGAYTNYTISNNYFEYHGVNDKKIHIDGFVSKGDNDSPQILTNVEIYGNTSSYGFELELSGVVIRRLDRIDTPSNGGNNYSTFTKCLFENIDLSDVNIVQFQDWNFSTLFPTSSIMRSNALIGETGNDLLSFDDCKGSVHMNLSNKAMVSVTNDDGDNYNLLITKLRPRFTINYTKVFIQYTISNKDYDYCATFPREIPYYAFLVFKNDNKIRRSDYNLILSAYNKGVDIEMSNITVYKTVKGAMYNYPYIIIPYRTTELIP